MKDIIFGRTTKTALYGALVGFFFGSFYGVSVQSDKVYKDCRFSGVIRIGEVAFKCDQFSKIVLLTPDEQAKKEEKKK